MAGKLNIKRRLIRAWSSPLRDPLGFIWTDFSVFRRNLCVRGFVDSPKRMASLKAFAGDRPLPGQSYINLAGNARPHPACAFEFGCLFEPGASTDADAEATYRALQDFCLVLVFEDGAQLTMCRSLAYHLHLRNDFTGALYQRQMSGLGQKSGLHVLDLGASGSSALKGRPETAAHEVTTFDIRPAAGVDVVGDAHELSSYFPPERFDFIQSLYVFEHLLMPWKVVLEVNKVAKVGARFLVITHMAAGCHALPWDFWRFSQTAWPALFNEYTGWRIVETAEFEPMAVIQRFWSGTAHEEAWGYFHIGVLAEKIGRPRVDWPVKLSALIKTEYPSS